MGYVSTGMGDRFSAILLFLMTLRLALLDQNPLRPFLSDNLQGTFYKHKVHMKEAHLKWRRNVHK